MIDRTKIKFCALLALSVFIALKIVTVDQPFSSVSFYNDEDRSELLKNAISINSQNPDVYFQLANRNDILLLSDDEEIKLFLLNTIKNNPLHAFALIKLADSEYESGNDELVSQIVNQANKFSNFSADRLWELSFIAYKLGEEELFNKSLQTITQIDDNRRYHVYKLALKLIDDKEEILRDVIHERSYSDYFGYVFSRMRDTENSQIIYNYLDENGIEVGNDTKLQYIDFLVEKGLTLDAKEVWSSLYGQNDDLVWNGGFEEEILNKGLGWKIDDKYDFNSETITEVEKSNPLRGKKSLKIKFLDKNVDFWNIRQTVLVKPNSEYIFSSLVSTKNITTKNGVGWEISCGYGGHMYKQTEYLTGTNTEKILFSKFKTPEDCNVLKINLRRIKSDKFDKYISGEIIVDEVFLEEVG